ncbi:MAG: glycoside hydrolase [Lachnospiraceae bacterium]|nr:glycoside hydrolase [Lachnospiraceae bacterium]
MYRFETKKDVIKAVRSTLELAVIAFLVFLAVRALVTFSHYIPYDPLDGAKVSGEDHGFIALSYTGVDRETRRSRISQNLLENHLKALHDLGYVTVSQKDIENYYNNGTPLPDRALFLMYEDGRNDTAVFAQAAMEKYNYMGTMFTYADKFSGRDSHFLMPKDLKELTKSGFWEIGTNGYRLSYINVFDRYGRFVGELTSDEYSQMAQYFGRDYNQYLMDFIRDENRFPVESAVQMRERIAGEYDLMEQEYTLAIGGMPAAYALMHANSGAFGTNDKVSAVNEECIRNRFALNFNREGYSLNTREVSVYDLTRMQPQSTWSVNHLLMRIRADLPEADKDCIRFVKGDKAQAANWTTELGIAEYKDEEIYLTSLPDGSGRLRLNKEPEGCDFTVSATLKGNKWGYQAIHLRANEDLSVAVSVILWNNMLQLVNNGEVLEEVDLRVFEGSPRISVEEDKRDSLAGEYGIFAKSATSVDASREYRRLQLETQAAAVQTVEQGAEEYIPEIQISEPGKRKLYIDLIGDRITVKVDDRAVWDGRQLGNSVSTDAGKDRKAAVVLESACRQYGYSQRYIVDDVYDGVFEKLTVKDAATGDVLYSNEATMGQGLKFRLIGIWNKVLNWFIENL